MDRLLYVAMSGAKHTMEQQAVVSHNLANASTVGFKAEMAVFRAVHTINTPSRTRSYVVDNTIGADFGTGGFMTTGRKLDVAVKNKGWLAVTALDGKEAYTRDGGLQVDSNGMLQTRNGLNIVGDGGPISVPPNNVISVGDDGTISAVPNDALPNSVAIVGRLKLVNPPEADLVRGDDGLFRLKSGEPAPIDENVQVSSGVLEMSNVSAVQMLVEMISHQRQFETQTRLMSTALENDRGWSQIMNLSA